MADELKWNYSLNAGLLYGNKQPPASFAIPLNRRGVALDTVATPAVPFKGTSFMNKQGGETARAAYFSYLRRMVALVDLPQGLADESGDEASGAQPQELRMVGVVTQLNDPHSLDAASRNAPWEFYQITDASNEDQLSPIIEALSATRPDISAAVEGGDNSEYVAGRVSLFCGKVSHFTGMYPGAVVGIIGTPWRRDMDGRLTSVLVSSLIQPRRPIPKWLGASSLTTANTHTPSMPRVAARVMYVSGPFPRREVTRILQSVVDNAVQRQATLLVIGGPIHTSYDESELTVVMAQASTFADQIDQTIGSLEQHLGSLSQTNPQAKALRIVVVPSLDDVTQIPVLPQLQHAVDTPLIMGTNPCRIVHNGITIGILQHDTVSDMREHMIERMQGREEGSLQRVVETILGSRLYTPMFQVPNPIVDTKHLAALSIAPDSPVVAMASEEKVLISTNGDSIDNIAKETEQKKSHTSISTLEDIPHLIFLPSSKPQFAFAARSSSLNGNSKEEEDAGPLVVNPMVWNHRNKRQMHFMNVVEVTIPDSAHAAKFGLAHNESDVAVSIFSAFRQ
ncbi:DNA polymerase alpha/epsilon subunit B, putative [Bodo saltans]|uniref:DNA polymerase alpha subunit B n=1 Tax=Bodo saltans TaxID=75058 RepID=A0A0S4JBE4_BODSA|nr:DNA polymerase alpha/epsilon subunit B, putative [Bodo saltans]|eukprot:CUG88809.1 DNA polymerase alpha/epsilon subunit B, putative [Bodo saltans]